MTLQDIFDFKKRFKEAITKTGLNESSFEYKLNKDVGTYVVYIDMPIYNENNYPIVIKKRFEKKEELNEFIKVLENIKIISLNKKYQVQLIPFHRGFNIFINGELVNPQSLIFYSDKVKRDIKASVRAAFSDVKFLSLTTNRLWKSINDKQFNIDKCAQLIQALNFNLDKKNQLRIIRAQTPIKDDISILAPADEYKIDFLEVIKIAEEYDNAADRNLMRIAEKKMLEQYEKIQTVIEAGKEITSNYFEICDNLTAYQAQMILNFINKLLIIVNDMNLNASMILDYKTEKLNNLQTTINNALTLGKEDSIRVISSIQLSDVNLPKRYKIRDEFPIISIPYMVYDKGSFNFEHEKDEAVFKQIQKQQLEKLTPEERDAIIFYKSMFFRPINKVVSFTRKNGLTLKQVEQDEFLSQQLIDIITKCYDEFINRKEEIKKNPNPFLFGRRISNPPAVERLFSKYYDHTPDKNEYIKIVLCSIPLLESALKKIEIPEDIVVYRGTNGLQLNADERFLSTSISLRVAKEFAQNEERNSNNGKTIFPNVFQIVLRKGSHVIAFTDDLFMDRYVEGNTFNEEQQEILIDPINFDFKLNYINSQTIPDGTCVCRINYEAHPSQKTNELEQESSKSI